MTARLSLLGAVAVSFLSYVSYSLYSISDSRLLTKTYTVVYSAKGALEIILMITTTTTMSRYLEVAVKVGVDRTLRTADRDLAMHSDRVETAENRQLKAFRARIHDNGIDAIARRVEVDQIHRRLNT